MKNEPWFREFDGWWYCYVRKNGKRRQVKLAQGKDNKAEAYVPRNVASEVSSMTSVSGTRR